MSGFGFAPYTGPSAGMPASSFDWLLQTGMGFAPMFFNQQMMGGAGFRGPFSPGGNIAEYMSQQAFNTQLMQMQGEAYRQQWHGVTQVVGGVMAGMGASPDTVRQTQGMLGVWGQNPQMAGMVGGMLDNMFPGFSEAIGGREGSLSMHRSAIAQALRYRTSLAQTAYSSEDLSQIGQLLQDEYTRAPDSFSGYGAGQLGRMTESAMRFGFSASTRVSPEDAQRMGGEDGKTQMRMMEAKRMADWQKGMTGVMRAMEDIFGPGKSFDEMFEAMNRMTAGGMANKTPEQLISQIRVLQETARMSNVSIDAIMQTGMNAGNVAMQFGGSAGMGNWASINAFQYMRGLESMGHGENMYAAMGTTSAQFVQHQAQLQAQAATSMSANAAGALLRNAGMLRPGSEAAKLLEQMNHGDAVTNLSAGRVAQLLREGSNMSESAIATALNSRNANLAAVEASPYAAASIRAGAWETDIVDKLVSATATPTLSKTLNAKTRAELFNRMRSFTPSTDSDKTAQEQMQDAMQKEIEAMGLAHGAQAQTLANEMIGAAEDYSRTTTVTADNPYGMTFAELAAQNNPEAQRRRAEGIATAQARAEVARHVDAYGRQSMGSRILDALKNVKSPEDLKNVLGSAIGVETFAGAKAWLGDEAATALIGETQAAMSDLDKIVSDRTGTPAERRKRIAEAKLRAKEKLRALSQANAAGGDAAAWEETAESFRDPVDALLSGELSAGATAGSPGSDKQAAATPSAVQITGGNVTVDFTNVTAPIISALRLFGTA